MRQQLIVGMPSSGKSTFIAALRHLLVADETATALQLVKLSDEESHVNALEDKWLSCREIERTKPATEGWVEFTVRNRKTGTESVLAIPDLRGETFEQPLCTGRCVKSLYEAVGNSDAILLFTNADRPDDAGLISDLNDMHENRDTPDTAQNNSKAAPRSQFKPEDMPEEVKIIEFLQMANRRPLQARKRRIGIVISAWDVVSSDVEPTQWFGEHRPMLDQFLANNADLWETRIYGVSAQGGKLPRDREILTRIRKPSQRIILVGDETLAHDLTSPLSWLGDM